MPQNKQFSPRQLGIMIAIGAMMMMPAMFKKYERMENREKTEQYAEKAGKQIQEMRQRKRAQEAQRTANFTDFINEDITRAVQENMTPEQIREFKQAYAQNPQMLDEYINQLAADSAQYAHTIAENAAMIHDVDVSQQRMLEFRDAIKKIDEIQAAAGNADNGITSTAKKQQKTLAKLQMARQLQNNIEK